MVCVPAACMNAGATVRQPPIGWGPAPGTHSDRRFRLRGCSTSWEGYETTHTQRHTETRTETHRQTHTCTQKHTDRQRHTDKNTQTHTQTHTHKHTDTQTQTHQETHRLFWHLLVLCVESGPTLFVQTAFPTSVTCFEGF